jgi:ketosteroid isomerase-like protein
MKRQRRAHIGRLFDALIRGQFEEFLSGCAVDIVVTARGSSPVPVTLHRSDISDWYGSLQALSPTSLRSSVEVVRVDEATATVILRHAFARNGIDYRLEMVNLLVLRDGLLSQWSSYPLDLSEYARAWRTHELSMVASL